MLVHADGIDFRALTPTWLAIGLFIALPLLFAISIAIVVDRLDRPEFVHAPRAGALDRIGRVRGIVPADGDPRRHLGVGLDGLGRSA